MNIDKAKEIFPNIDIVNVVDGKVVLDKTEYGCLSDPYTTTIATIETEKEPNILEIQKVARYLNCDHYHIDNPNSAYKPDYTAYKPYYKIYISKIKTDKQIYSFFKNNLKIKIARLKDELKDSDSAVDKVIIPKKPKRNI
jgi:hypothetical protein